MFSPLFHLSVTFLSGVKRLLDDFHKDLPLGTFMPSGLLHPNSIKYGELPLDFNNSFINSLSGSEFLYIVWE